MAIVPFSESVGTFSNLAKMLPHTRNNRPIHANTLRRSAFTGRRGVKLETIMMIGGVTCSSREAQARGERVRVGRDRCVGRDGSLQTREDRRHA
jgi:hypothetical protein